MGMAVVLCPVGNRRRIGLLQQALADLETNYAVNVTLDDLATQTHLSPYHLLRCFKITYGLPPTPISLNCGYNGPNSACWLVSPLPPLPWRLVSPIKAIEAAVSNALSVCRRGSMPQSKTAPFLEAAGAVLSN